MAWGLARCTPNALHCRIAGPWETVGFGIMGAYGLNKLDEFEQWSKAKYLAEFTRKLDRNRVRARRPRSAPHASEAYSHALRRRVTADLVPPPGQDAMDDTYQSVLGENFSKWFVPKVV